MKPIWNIMNGWKLMLPNNGHLITLTFSSVEFKLVLKK